MNCQTIFDDSSYIFDCRINVVLKRIKDFSFFDDENPNWNSETVSVEILKNFFEFLEKLFEKNVICRTEATIGAETLSKFKK